MLTAGAVEVMMAERWVDVEEEEAIKGPEMETVDQFEEVKKLEENRRYAFSKTQLEVSGLAGAQMRPTAPLQVWQVVPSYDAECPLQQRKICNSKLPLERIRVDKVAQQILVKSLHSRTGALGSVMRLMYHRCFDSPATRSGVFDVEIMVSWSIISMTVGVA